MKRVLLTIFLALALTGCRPNTDQQPTPAPPLEGAMTWLNSPAVSLETLRGKVVLLHFFDYASAGSVDEIPQLKEWGRRYSNGRLVLLGIHTPEHDFALNPINVSVGVRRLEISYPVAVDSDFKIAGAYGRKSIPATILLDKAGHVRFQKVGPGRYAETETAIQILLHELNPHLLFPAPVPDPPGPGPVTPSLYLGTNGGPLGNAPASITNGVAQYTLPATMGTNRVYVAGVWMRQENYLRHAADVPELTDALVVRYHGAGVRVVMKTEDVYWKEVLVQLDGQWLPREVAGKDVSFDEKGRSFVRVNMAALYEIVAQQTAGTHELKLFVQGKGLSVYSIHFGDGGRP